MRRFPFAALTVLIMASLACGLLDVPTTDPAEPAVSDDTDVPAPTATISPTDTPVPTSTPDAAATAAFSATQSASDVRNELDDLFEGSDEVSYQEGSLLWKQPDPISINMRGPDDSFIPLDEDISAGNFIIKSDVTWEATGILICGLIFRSEPDITDGKQYAFLFLRFSGAPAWDIEVHQFGRFRNSPTGVNYSQDVDLRNGKTNQILIVVQDDHFIVYINQERQGRFFDYSKQRMDGYFGFLASQDSGNGTCEYENTWIWSLD